jgi:hypothetical protein
MDGDVFDTDLFMDEVEKRPAIWDSHVYTVAVIWTRTKRASNAPHLNLSLTLGRTWLNRLGQT